MLEAEENTGEVVEIGAVGEELVSKAKAAGDKSLTSLGTRGDKGMSGLVCSGENGEGNCSTGIDNAEFLILVEVRGVCKAEEMGTNTAADNCNGDNIVFEFLRIEALFGVRMLTDEEEIEDCKGTGNEAVEAEDKETICVDADSLVVSCGKDGSFIRLKEF